MKYLIPILIVLFSPIATASDGEKDTGFKPGQMYGQKSFCFDEDSIYQYVEADAENPQKSYYVYEFLKKFGKCADLTKVVPVVVREVLMDYTDTQGKVVQVMIVDMEEPLRSKLQQDKTLYAVVYRHLAKDAPYSKNSI